MIDYPLVSILIATYNYEKYIGSAIQSIIDQNYPNDKIEIIIIDDGSIDNTKTIVQKYTDKIKIKYEFQNNHGKASATKKGINYTNGKYTFILDADDYYLPECLSTVVKKFEEDNELVQVSHLANRLENGDKIIPQSIFHPQPNKCIDGIETLKNKLFKEWTIGLGSTFAAKTEVLRQIQIPSDIDMYIDFHLFIQIATKGKIMQITDILSVFRRHEKSYSEGTIKFEDAKKRGLRYLKSAQAICNENQKLFKSSLIRKYLNLFYFKHLWSSKKYTEINKSLVFVKIIFYTTCLLPFNKSKLSFLKSNISSLLR